MLNNKEFGIEFTLDANVIKSEDLNFDLGFNISTNTNEITELTQEEFIWYKEVDGWKVTL